MLSETKAKNGQDLLVVSPTSATLTLGYIAERQRGILCNWNQSLVCCNRNWNRDTWWWNQNRNHKLLKYNTTPHASLLNHQHNFLKRNSYKSITDAIVTRYLLHAVLNLQYASIKYYKFLNGDRGQRAFNDRFGLEKIEQNRILKSNQPFISDNTPNVPPHQIIIQHIHQHHHTDPIEPDHVPAKVKRQIENDCDKILKEELVSEHHHHSI